MVWGIIGTVYNRQSLHSWVSRVRYLFRFCGLWQGSLILDLAAVLSRPVAIEFCSHSCLILEKAAIPMAVRLYVVA